MERSMSNVTYRIRVEEGTFGPNFGPNFNIVVGGGVGVPLGLILALSKKKKRKLSAQDVSRIRRLISLLDRLELLRYGSAA